MMKSKLSTFLRNLFSRSFVRSGMLPGIVLGVLVIGLGFVYRERGRGHLHKLEVKIGTGDTPQWVPPPRPGSQDPLVVTRTRLVGGTQPEFLTATILPGRGGNTFQITAYLPDKGGEVSLLASPTLQQAADSMTGKDTDENGQASLRLGGPIEMPWAGRMLGLPSQNEGRLNTIWHQHLLSLPISPDIPSESIGGMMLMEGADVIAPVTPATDGGTAHAVFHAGDFGAHWPSDTDVTVTMQLASRSIELTILAKNTGDAPEPIGIGWMPRFAILDGNRSQIELRLPDALRVEVADKDLGIPTGKLLPVAGSPVDFTHRGGKTLEKAALNDVFVQLHQEMLENGPVAEIHDPANHYGLRLTLLTPTIKALRVYAPSDGNFVALEPRFNYDDPFGKQWPRDTDTGMVILQPGGQTQWKVRLEIFSLGGEKQAAN